MRFLIRRIATGVNLFRVNTARHASNDAQKKEPSETKVEEVRKSTYLFIFNLIEENIFMYEFKCTTCFRIF